VTAANLAISFFNAAGMFAIVLVIGKI